MPQQCPVAIYASPFSLTCSYSGFKHSSFVLVQLHPNQLAPHLPASYSQSPPPHHTHQLCCSLAVMHKNKNLIGFSLKTFI